MADELTTAERIERIAECAAGMNGALQQMAAQLGQLHEAIVEFNHRGDPDSAGTP